MKIKRLVLLMFVVVVGFVFAGCDRDPAPTNNKPVFSGVEDITIDKGSEFKPLEGVTAHDEEDGDLTEFIEYSGNVNVNVPNDYFAEYRVTDSDNNTVKVTRKITVVLNDTTAPFITGVGNVELIVGDLEFTLLGGVEANDTVDGNLTSQIQTSGHFDPWTPGTYQIEYSVKDSSNNEKKLTRTIVVNLGQFIFMDDVLNVSTVTFDEGVYEVAVAGGENDGVLANFSLAKLTFKAVADATSTLEFTMTNSTSIGEIEIGTTEEEYVVYFRVSEEIIDGLLTLDCGDFAITVTDLTLSFGEARDEVLPVISVPETTIVVPSDLTDAAVIKRFILTNVTATDNVDGIITSRLDVDLSNITLGEFSGLTNVTIFVLDSSNNRAEATRNVEFASSYSTNFITDPTFSTGDTSQWGLNSGAGSPVLEIVDGVLVHRTTVDANPGWDSASSPRLESTTDLFREGNYYLLKFDVKAEKNRKMTIRIGLDTTEGAGWIENFAGASNTPFNLTQDWQTCYVVFYVHASRSQGSDSNVVKVEFKVGTFTWGSEERLNTVSLDNVQFYLLSNENHAPELTLNEDLPTTFAKDEAMPDFTQYIKAYDQEDAQYITVLASHINASAVNMSAVGEYDVIFTIPDSEGEEATYTLRIKVIAEKDEEAPVLAEKDDLVKVIDQFSDAVDLLNAITAVDNIDGAIQITSKMIFGTVDTLVTGSYEVTYTVKDSSGNESSLTVTFVVNDKEAPKFTGNNKVTVTVGDSLDLLKLVTVKDNVDGTLTLTMANVSGFNAFMLDGVVNKTGEYELTYTISDNAGNEGTYVVTVTVNPKGETELVEDEVFLDILASKPAIDSGSTNMATVAYDDATGEATIAITDVGGWFSAAKMKIKLTNLVSDEIYKVKITVKADQARSLKFVVGQALWSDPWYNKFTLLEGTEVFTITDQYQSYELLFVSDKAFKDGGPTLEFDFGKGSHAGDVAGNNVYISSFEVIKMKEVPVVSESVAINILENQPAIDSGSTSMATVTYDDVTGEATIAVSDVGGWFSAAKMKISLAALEHGKTYKLKVTVKADAARSLKFNIGQALWADPWLDRFTTVEGNELIEITDTYATYEVTFTYDKTFKDGGPMIEFCFGKGAHAGDVAGNNIYINEFKILNIVEETPVEETVVINILENEPAIDSGSTSMATVTYDDVTGEATIAVSDVGGWFSAAKMKISLAALEHGKTYKLKVTVKADAARSLKFNIGQALWADPWLDRFTTVEGNELIEITDTYATYEVTFTYDKTFKDGGPMIEFCFGKGAHAGDVAGNNIYINEFLILSVE